jgi:hypothetical protein
MMIRMVKFKDHMQNQVIDIRGNMDKELKEGTEATK